MDYENNERSEGFEEMPKSFLQRKSRGGGKSRKTLPFILIGGALVICLAAVILVLAVNKNSPEQTQHKKTLELGGAKELPEAGNRAEPVSQREIAIQSGGIESLESTLDDMDSRMEANHEQVMKRLSELAKRIVENTEKVNQLVAMQKDLEARLANLEKQYQQSGKETAGGTAETEKQQQAPAGTESEKEKARDIETKKPEKKYYAVQKNDTLYSIARDNGLKLETLLKINDLNRDSVIHPGDKLLISR